MGVNCKLLVVCAVSLLTVSCGVHKNSDKVSLVGTSWVLDSTNFDMSNITDMPILVLGDSSSLSGSAICNIFFGEYYLSGDTLNLSVVGATSRLCENENLDVLFLDILGQTQFYESPKDNVLILKDANMNVLGKFKKNENEKN